MRTNVRKRQRAQQRARVRSMLKIIQSRWKRPPSLTKIASRMGLATNTLCQQFQRVTGMKFVETTNRFRLERAEKLLCRTHQEVKEIADKTGFGHYSTFLDAFKKRHGCTPRVFRKRSQHTTAPVTV